MPQSYNSAFVNKIISDFKKGERETSFEKLKPNWLILMNLYNLNLVSSLLTAVLLKIKNL